MQVRSVPTVEFIEPTISNAAADAGRPKPRIIAVVPALVSDDVEGVASAADSLRSALRSRLCAS
jgi:alkanesulfonate monooxygenase SsuD/methylene tetrahydromethanopterin reductase-like flavin-dependent oxidoreductase (luciferase family)